MEHEFEKEIHLLTAPGRLEAIAKDFVGHYSDLWTSGKAMFVCLNKVTCVRMYDYVQKYWKAEIASLKEKLKSISSQQESLELQRKIAWMEQTEMAVVISQEQNEIQTFKKWGLDILPHRAKMEKRELDKEFKDKDNPLRVVFVCAMWLTGFDVKCLSCLYLDKPLKAHTLMQTIARANRVAEGKSNGLIIDYIGIVKALRKALADYTANKAGGCDPTFDKDELIRKVVDAIREAEAFLKGRDFELRKLMEAKDFAKLALLQDAANIVSESQETKKQFTTYASEIIRLTKLINKSDLSDDDNKKKEAIEAIYAELQKKRKHVDNTDLMVEINGILGDYIFVEEQKPGLVESKQFDISKIDFDLLRKEFVRAKRKNLVLHDIQDLVSARLASMLGNNPNRVNYYDRYMTIIDEYNREQNRATIEKTFMDLMDLANQMTKEEQRYVREGFDSDEELSLYDLLFKDDLSKDEIKELKKVAVDLLRKIKDKISQLDHWTDKPETKAVVDNLIRDTLWEELPESYDEHAISKYRMQIYEYVFTRYRSVA